MSLQANLAELILAVGTDIKILQSKIGDTSTLTTTEKASLVAAINELKTSLDAIGPTIYVQSSAPTAGLTVGDLWVQT